MSNTELKHERILDITMDKGRDGDEILVSN